MANESTGNAFRALLLIAAAACFCLAVYLPPPVVEAEEDAPEGAADAVATIDAAPLWAKNCKSCHGDDGRGNTKIGKMKKVQDLTAADVRAAFDRERMIQATTVGVTNDAGKVVMKGYSEKLTAEQIAALIDYIYALPH